MLTGESLVADGGIGLATFKSLLGGANDDKAVMTFWFIPEYVCAGLILAENWAVQAIMHSRLAP